MELAKCRAGDGAVYIRITSEERLTGTADVGRMQ